MTDTTLPLANDQLHPAPAAPPLAQVMASEEAQWRENEKHMKELTFDAERKELDLGIQHEEAELVDFRNFPLQKLVQAGVISVEKAQELQAENIETLDQLLEWTNQKND